MRISVFVDSAMKKTNFIFSVLYAITAGFLVVFMVYAWTNPTSNPPTDGGTLNYSNGKINIGAPLEVSDSSDTLLKLIRNSTASTTLRLGTDNGFVLSVTDSPDIIKILNGNIGISSSTPGYKLDVNGKINTSDSLCIRGDCKTAWNQIAGISGTADYIPKFITGTSLGDSVIFQSGGNIGIGTTNPSLPSSTQNTAGPNNGSSFDGTTDANGGTVIWSGPASAQTSNNIYATTIPNATKSYRLKATGFGFVIPPSASIQGVKVRVERREGPFSGDLIEESEISLIVNGMVDGSNKAANPTWTTSDTYYTYGGETDLWGLGLTPSNINSSNFGVSIQLSGNVNETAYIDHIEITVYYQSDKVVDVAGYVKGQTGLCIGDDCQTSWNSAPGNIKAWVNFNGANGSILSDFKTSSVTRTARGEYTINWDASTFSTSNYVIICSSMVSGAGVGVTCNTKLSGQSINSVNITTINNGQVTVDPITVYAIAVGS